VLYLNGDKRGEEVAIMKMTTIPKVSRRRMAAMTTVKHGMMLRRSTNLNAHIITHHGKIQVGRKGRNG
jgi:hypothetical protein